MIPRLIAISGSLKGTIFNLADHETLIGRDSANAIHLNDISVSRRHCLIRRAPPPAETIGGESQVEGVDDVTQQATAPGQFTIRDLESYNGTFINGIPIRDQQLTHGDQIAVGDVVLLFLSHDADTPMPGADDSAEVNVITRSTVRLRREDALYLRPEKVAAELPISARVARDLNALLKISTSINSLARLSDL